MHFLRQIKCHLLGNHVLLNMQFSLFVTSKKRAIPFVHCLTLLVFFSKIRWLAPFPRLRTKRELFALVRRWLAQACTNLVEACFTCSVSLLFGFLSNFGCVCVWGGCHPIAYTCFFLFLCPLQKKYSTLLLAP